MYLLLAIIYLSFMLISVHLNDFMLNNQIFVNQQRLWLQQAELKANMRKCCYDSGNLGKFIGFLPDNLAIDSVDGINIYAKSIGDGYGYVGCRGKRPVNNQLLLQQQQGYTELLLSHNITAVAKLKIIDFGIEEQLQPGISEHSSYFREKDGNDSAHRSSFCRSNPVIYFIQNSSELWCYNVKLQELRLIYVATGMDIIDYQVIRDLGGVRVLSNSGQINYMVCLQLRGKNIIAAKAASNYHSNHDSNNSHSADNRNYGYNHNKIDNTNNSNTDLIKLIEVHINNSNSSNNMSVAISEHIVVASTQQILSFFIRLNNIIVVYEDLGMVPEIYRIAEGAVGQKKLDVGGGRDREAFSRGHGTVGIAGSCALIWDEQEFKHKLLLGTSGRSDCVKGKVDEGDKLYGGSKLKVYEFNLNNDYGLLTYRID